MATGATPPFIHGLSTATNATLVARLQKVYFRDLSINVADGQVQTFLLAGLPAFTATHQRELRSKARELAQKLRGNMQKSKVSSIVGDSFLAARQSQPLSNGAWVFNIVKRFNDHKPTWASTFDELPANSQMNVLGGCLNRDIADMIVLSHVTPGVNAQAVFRDYTWNLHIKKIWLAVATSILNHADYDHLDADGDPQVEWAAINADLTNTIKLFEAPEYTWVP